MPNIYQPIIDFFEQGKKVDLHHNQNNNEYKLALKSVPQLENLIKSYVTGITKQEMLFYMEFCLHGMAAHSLINKSIINDTIQFGDLMGSMLILKMMN